MVILILSLVLVGLYAVQDQEPKPAELESTSVATSTSNAESYLTKLKIDLTDEVYPTDVNQPARLRHYVGRVQNLGDRTISNVVLKINFLDSAGLAIKDQVITLDQSLKPNFIEEFQFGGLFVPAEWSGRVNYKVIELRFVGEQPAYRSPVSPRESLDRPLPEIVIPLGL